MLLARLALRAGDVASLRLTDIDWRRARLHVSGKSKRRVGLPLPQDAGDALLEYIEHARPRMDEEKVFLRGMAPHRPLAGGGTNHRCRGPEADRRCAGPLRNQVPTRADFRAARPLGPEPLPARREPHPEPMLGPQVFFCPSTPQFLLPLPTAQGRYWTAAMSSADRARSVSTAGSASGSNCSANMASLPSNPVELYRNGIPGSEVLEMRAKPVPYDLIPGRLVVYRILRTCGEKAKNRITSSQRERQLCTTAAYC